MASQRSALTRVRDPFTMMRQMTSELDRMFGGAGWPSFSWPPFGERTSGETAWYPEVDVFEKDNKLMAKVDLPGMKKNDVKVEVTDGHLAISGERRSEAEEKKDNVYRCERRYGSFYRTIPLPQGARPEDVKATFSDGVLEISVPLPAQAQPAVRTVEVQEAPAAGSK